MILAWLLLAATAAAAEIEISPTIAGNLRTLATYRLHQGRIVVDTSPLAGQVNLRGPRPSTPERLTMTVDEHFARIHYTQATWQQEVTLTCERDADRESWEVTLERRPRGRSSVAYTRLRQRRSEPLELKLAGQTTLRADTLWQLWREQPHACAEHLEPLLLLLRPGWEVDSQAQQAERLARIFVHEDTPAARLRWQERVAELGSDAAGTRAVAWRALRSDAPGNLAYLSELDRSRLDAEQRHQLRRLLKVYLLADEDTPASVALAGRKRDGTSKARRHEEDKRHLEGERR